MELIKRIEHPNILLVSTSVDLHLRQQYDKFLLSAEKSETFNTLFDNLSNVITKTFPEAAIQVYGSFGAGVAVSRSDLDLCVTVPVVADPVPKVREVVYNIL